MGRTRLHPAALAELEAEADYLDQQRVGLGDRFLSEVDEALLFIESTPSLGAPHPPYSWRERELRAKRVGRFRIWLVYWVSDPILVLAAKHERQHPDHWKTRLP